VWDAPNQTLTTQRAPVGAGHVGLRPGLVDEDQALGINTSLVTPPAGTLTSDVGSLLLGGAQGFF
jgi:hypothetical protein